MEEPLSPVAVTHLLQHTLRSLCTGDSSSPQWVYAVFWRILPRNYPPPKWDLPGAAYDRTRGNRRNWILAWEDGFCNFAAATSAACGQEGAAAYAGDCEAAVAQEAAKHQHHQQQPPQPQGLQPELFFKMSHDIYNYGEGLIGKVAADHSHKWVFKEPQEHEINLISSWSNPADSHPRTWEAQFQSGIQTIALIAVREGVVQLGSMKKVAEDLSYVVMLRRKFGYLESIPGVLLPHPSSAGVFPGGGCVGPPPPDMVAAAGGWPGMMPLPAPHAGLPLELYDPYGAAVAAGPAAAAAASMHIMPSMSSLEALLSKLPSVVPAPQTTQPPPSGADPRPAWRRRRRPTRRVRTTTCSATAAWTWCRATAARARARAPPPPPLRLPPRCRPTSSTLAAVVTTPARGFSSSKLEPLATSPNRARRSSP